MDNHAVNNLPYLNPLVPAEVLHFKRNKYIIRAQCNTKVKNMGADIFSVGKDDADHHKSKTQLKKDMLALVKLGERIVELSAAHLRQLPLDEELARRLTLLGHEPQKDVI